MESGHLNDDHQQQQQQQQQKLLNNDVDDESFQFDFSSDKSLHINNCNNHHHHHFSNIFLSKVDCHHIQHFIKQANKVDRKLNRFNRKYIEKAIFINKDTLKQLHTRGDESIAETLKRRKQKKGHPNISSLNPLPPPASVDNSMLLLPTHAPPTLSTINKEENVDQENTSLEHQEEVERKQEQEERLLREAMEQQFSDQLIKELTPKFPAALREDELRTYKFKGFIPPFPGGNGSSLNYGLIKSKEILPRVINESTFDWFKSLWAIQVQYSFALVYQSHLPISNSPLLELVGEEEISFLPKLNHIVGICVYFEVTGNIVYYLPLNNPKDKSIKYQVTKTGKLNHIEPKTTIVNNNNGLDIQSNTTEFLSKCKILAKTVLEHPTTYKYLYNCKAQLKMLMSLNIFVKKGIMDPRIGAWLLDPDKYKDTTLDTLCKEFDCEKKMFNNIDPLNHYDRSYHHCYRSFQLMRQLIYRFNFNRDLFKIFNEIEMPILVILAKMEYHGIGFDDDSCQKTKYEVLQKLQYIECKARLLVPNIKFSMSSKEDMSNIIYKILRLIDPPTRGKVMKRHHSTNAQILESIPEEKSAFPKLLMEWRKLSHHILTYVHVLFKFGYYNEDYGMMRIYTTIMQTNVPTGRLAMTYPNLQSIANAFAFRESPITFSDLSTNNVSKASSNASQNGSPPYDHHNVSVDYTPSPSESESIGSLETLEMKENNCRIITIRIRDSFIARKGYIYLSADYSQIELRILAHLSKDKLLLEGFNNPKFDFFKTIYVQMNPEKRIQEVTSEEREIAKELCYGILYGMGNWRLSTKIDRSVNEAKQLKEKLNNTYVGLNKYIENVKKQSQQVGYVETVYRRRRYIDNLCRDVGQVEKEKRKAVNSIPQGTAADIIKQAMIAIDRTFIEKNVPALMVLQIHDELLFEVREDCLKQVATIVKKEMEGVKFSDIVSIPVKLSTGNRWGSLSPYSIEEDI